jgi:hypothetical protein
VILSQVTDEQRQWAEDYISRNNIGQRGEYDGSRSDQVIGKIGEKVVADKLQVSLVNSRGFDNGIDMVYHKFKIDVKTKLRRCKMKPWYGFNIPVSQYNSYRFENNVYLFCSYSDTDNTLTTHGFIKKPDVRTRSIYLPRGSYRIREDGKKFPSDSGYPVPTLEILNAGLVQLNTWEDFRIYAQGLNMFDI